MKIKIFLIFVILFGSSNYAKAGSFCVSFSSGFFDSDVGEDYLPHLTDDSPTAWMTTTKLLGNFVVIKKFNDVVYYNFLNDQGCTDTFSISNGTYTVDVYSWGILNSTAVKVHSLPSKEILKHTFSVLVNSSNPNKKYSLDRKASTILNNGVWQTYIAASNTVKNINIENALQFIFYVGDLTSITTNGDSVYSKNPSPEFFQKSIFIRDVDFPGEVASRDSKRKFVISHEMGHYIFDTWSHGYSYSASDPGANDSQCPSPDGHNLISKETVGAAADEGFSHYISALAWNNPNEMDCFFEYWGTLGSMFRPTIDCQSDTDFFVDKYMRTNCTATGFNGRGVELDWMKAFWDLDNNENLNCINSINISNVEDWILSTPLWFSANCYDVLNGSAQMQSTTFKNCWNQSVVLNGIND